MWCDEMSRNDGSIPSPCSSADYKKDLTTGEGGGEGGDHGDHSLSERRTIAKRGIGCLFQLPGYLLTARDRRGERKEVSH